MQQEQDPREALRMSGGAPKVGRAETGITVCERDGSELY